VGTILSRSEALRLALMSSENRAAHALGRTHPAGLAAFVGMMNAKAKSLGMTQTSYVDPTGLSALNRSSARDLAALAFAASRYPLLRDYSTTAAYRTDIGGKRPLQYVNSNRLVRNGGWDIELQKTGYIIEAGHCAVMRARMGERDWVMVLLDAGGNASRSADAERIRRWIDPSYEPPKPKAAKTGRKAERKDPGGRVRRSFSHRAT
jgi:D-alanyl-D-alanine endopeptidase (penicillin-binding protein 7)